jgi:cell division protein FtsB
MDVMRDIGSRIGRYRLSRYAPPRDAVRRRLRWIWLAALAWIAWAGLLSDHSFYRLWRLEQEQQRTQLELERTRREIVALEKESRDPEARRDRNEREMRRAGMARENEIVYRIHAPSTDSVAH